MEIQVIVNDVKVNADEGVHHFEMESDNAFLFETLIQFYKKIIESILRELSSNAWDQHVVAGKPDMPFAIHLPTTLENYFSISDFGTGIPPEDFAKVYCVFGGSNKRNNPNTIGGFGLGSKTPFAYSNNYLVTNRYEGVAYTYSFFRGEDNRPDFVLLGSSETEESNGLTIQFSVHPKDFDAFKRAAFDACKFMQVKPTTNLEMNWNQSADQQEKQFEQSDWFVLEKSLSHYQRNFVVLGVIEYPVDVSDVLQAMEDEQYDELVTDKVREVLDLGVYLKFDIGALRPIPSRESLMWNSSNTQKVVARCLAVHEYIGAYLKEKIEVGTTDFERALSFVAYFDKGQNNGNHLKKIYQHYASVAVDDKTLFEIEFDAPHYGIYNLPNNRKETLSRIRRNNHEKYGLHLNLLHIAQGLKINVAVSSGKIGFKSHLKDTYNKYAKFVLVDKKQAEFAIEKLQDALKQHGAEQYVTLTNFDNEQPAISRLGGGGGRVKGKVKANLVSLHSLCDHYKVRDMCIESEFVDCEDEFYYVLRDRTELLSSNFYRVNGKNLAHLLDLDIDPMEQNILILNETEYDKLSDKLNLICLKSVIDKKLKELEMEVNLIASKRVKITHNYNLNAFSHRSKAMETYLSELTADSRFKQLLLDVQEDAQFKKADAFFIEDGIKENTYLKWFGKEEKETLIGKHKAEMAIIQKYYPMIANLFSDACNNSSLFLSKDCNLVLFYIKQMDMQHRLDLFKAKETDD